MTLADFIEANLTDLVQDWTDYAKAIAAQGHPLTQTQLRDAGAEILRAIAANMRIPQSAAQQQAKSHGSRDPSSAFNLTAGSHANLRVVQGFDINDVVAEFRALRAAVLRRWARSQPTPSVEMLDELTRFNEAIDQAVAESVRAHSTRVDHGRDLFVAVLAHDLRSPLGAITNSADVLRHAHCAPESSRKMVAVVERAATRMQAMLDDLLVFTRTRLSDALPLRLEPVDLHALVAEAAAELRCSFPAIELDLQLIGPLAGSWDRRRVLQLLVNLLVNAARYGDGRISLGAHAGSGRLMITVFNTGQPIPPELLPTLFDPLTRMRLAQLPSQS
ncbi:sensor histidine kinase [Burkholderia cenocepacia]|nr:sensor histidine kinase [Burkholderia cenocepacia]